MKRFVTPAIILRRTDYGEADRILTALTPEQGKLRLMAKGVRRMKSKMAGGIDLFTVSSLTVLEGKGDMGTLISARMQQHYGRIVRDLDRVQLGYDLIKLLDKVTEDNPEPDYFQLLEQAFQALDEPAIDLSLIRLWFQSQLLRIAGHSPNLVTDTDGQKLAEAKRYKFDFEVMAFAAESRGRFDAGYIKLLRLLFAGHTPAELAKVQGIAALLPNCQLLMQTMLSSHIRI